MMREVSRAKWLPLVLLAVGGLVLRQLLLFTRLDNPSEELAAASVGRAILHHGDFTEYEAFVQGVLTALRARPSGTPSLEWTLHNLGASLVDGLWVEFGVYLATSTNKLARNLTALGSERHVIAFDSFQGLPEEWRRNPAMSQKWHSRWVGKGAFDIGGEAPFWAEKNIDFVVGWFNESVPQWVSEELPKLNLGISLLHIDSDIYSSAATVLENLEGHLYPGCVVVFDELINYAEFRDHEMKALWEFYQRLPSTRSLEVLGYPGPQLLGGTPEEIQAAITKQGKEHGAYQQNAVVRVW